MWATFNRFEIRVTKNDAFIGSHPGRCDDDITELRTVPYIRRQLDAIDKAQLRAELEGYGAWDDNELDNHDANLNRILWLACGNIAEEIRS